MSTLRLYEIADSYLCTLEALSELEDLPIQVIADTLESLQGPFEQKAANVAAYIKTLEAEATAIEETCKGMMQRQRSLENHANRLREYLKQQLERTGIYKLKNTWVALRVQINPPSVVVEDQEQIPACYKRTEITIKLLRSEMAKALKSGEQVPGAHLEQTTRLVIQ